MAARCLQSDHVFCNCRLNAIVQARIVRGLSANRKLKGSVVKVGVATSSKRERAVSLRQASQCHLDYALQFITARAARSLDRHSVDDRRDVASKVSRVHIGRQVTIGFRTLEAPA